MNLLSIFKLQRCSRWSSVKMIYFIPHFTWHMITYPLRLNRVSKCGSRLQCLIESSFIKRPDHQREHWDYFWFLISEYINARWLVFNRTQWQYANVMENDTRRCRFLLDVTGECHKTGLSYDINVNINGVRTWIWSKVSSGFSGKSHNMYLCIFSTISQYPYDLWILWWG